MRLLLFSQYFWPENFPINSLCQSLSEKQVQVEVLTSKPNYPEGKIFSGYKAWGILREYFNGVLVNRIPQFPRSKGGIRLGINYLSFMVSGFFFAPWLLRRKNFDVIFVYAPSPVLQAIPAIWLGWIKKIPVVLWVQDLWPESLTATGYRPNRFSIYLVKLLVKFIYRHCDLILVQSEAFIGPVTKLEGLTPIEYYPNSVSQEFTKTQIDEIPQIDGLGNGFSIVFAGNIGRAQAVDVIVATADRLREYKEIHFYIIGDGSMRKWLEDEIDRLKLSNFHLPGKFPLENMPGILQNASALLVTLADQEIFAATIPSKVQAYMATGKPIVASLNGEGARLIKVAGAGLVAEAENVMELSESILNLYHMSPEQLRTMGDNGKMYYEQHFCHDLLTSTLISKLKAVISTKDERQ